MTREISLGEGYCIEVYFDPQNGASVKLQGPGTWDRWQIRVPGFWASMRGDYWWSLEALPQAIALAVQQMAIDRAQRAEFAAQASAATVACEEVAAIWKQIEA